MARFLSPEWVVELDDALRRSPLRADGPASSLAYQLETSDPRGRVRTHHIVIGVDGARATDGPAEDPDLVLVTDETTAFALHRNEINAQAAIASGRLRIRGDLEAFSRHATTISSLADLFSTLRAATTPDDDDR